jgi:hypothetical protein
MPELNGHLDQDKSSESLAFRFAEYTFQPGIQDRITIAGEGSEQAVSGGFRSTAQHTVADNIIVLGSYPDGANWSFHVKNPSTSAPNTVHFWTVYRRRRT